MNLIGTQKYRWNFATKTPKVSKKPDPKNCLKINDSEIHKHFLSFSRNIFLGAQGEERHFQSVIHLWMSLYSGNAHFFPFFHEGTKFHNEEQILLLGFEVQWNLSWKPSLKISSMWSNWGLFRLVKANLLNSSAKIRISYIIFPQ